MGLPGKRAYATLPLRQTREHRRQSRRPQHATLVRESANHLAILAEIVIGEADRPRMLVSNVITTWIHAFGRIRRTRLVITCRILFCQHSGQRDVK